MTTELTDSQGLTPHVPYHVPVMLHPCLDALDIKPDGIYADVTFGGGGHSRAIVERLTKGKLYAFDRDADAEPNAAEFPAEKFQLIKSDYRHLKRYLALYGVKQVDGILADLGVSSHQFDEAGRGFSIRHEGPLDMRMDQSQDTTAADVLNDRTAEDLQNIFGFFGEVHNARTLAQAVVKARILKPFKTIADLKAVAEPLAPKFKDFKYLAQVFQALRIEVNQELDSLKEMLVQCGEVIRPDGRLVVMSYHSLEDRLVKNLIMKGNLEGKDDKDLYGNPNLVFKALNRKPIEADEAEQLANPRSRSAKLRVGVRL